MEEAYTTKSSDMSIFPTDKEVRVSVTVEQYAEFIWNMQKLEAVRAILNGWSSFSDEMDLIIALQRIVS